MRQVQKDAIEFLHGKRSDLEDDPLVQYAILDSVANVLCPACKLWNTGHGAQMMREAVSLMGGYGITEDCPGFLGHKWMDSQLEATYEGPEVVQRRQLSVTITLVIALNVLVWLFVPGWPTRTMVLCVSLLGTPVLHTLLFKR